MVDGTPTSVGGDVTLAGDSSDNQAQLEATVAGILAGAFGVPVGAVEVSAEFTVGGRRLAAGTWTFEFEVVTTKANADAVSSDVLQQAFVNDGFVEVVIGQVDVVTMTSQPTGAPTGAPTGTPTDAPSGTPTDAPTTPLPAITAPLPAPTATPELSVSEDEVVSGEASSSSAVIVLGGIVVVVLFVAILLPALCKRRLRALFGRKGNNNALPQVSKSNSLDSSGMEWDVDKKQGAALENIEGGQMQSTPRGSPRGHWHRQYELSVEQI